MAELAAYRLNTPTLQKVVVATQAFGAAIQNDPQFKRYAAAEKELKALQAKDEPSEADEKRIEALERKVDKLGKGASSGTSRGSTKTTSTKSSGGSTPKKS